MKKYIGVKFIEAEPMVRNGAEGYKVIYNNNYESWYPKDVFEEAYVDVDIESDAYSEIVDKAGKLSCSEMVDRVEKLLGTQPWRKC